MLPDVMMVPTGRGLVSCASNCIDPPRLTWVRFTWSIANSRGSFPGLLVSMVKCALLQSMLSIRKLSKDFLPLSGATPPIGFRRGMREMRLRRHIDIEPFQLHHAQF